MAIPLLAKESDIHACMTYYALTTTYTHACMTYYALTTTNHSIDYCVKNAVLNPSACCKQENGLASALPKTNNTCWVSVFLASMYSQPNISASCTCSYLTRPVFKKSCNNIEKEANNMHVKLPPCMHNRTRSMCTKSE